MSLNQMQDLYGTFDDELITLNMFLSDQAKSEGQNEKLSLFRFLCFLCFLCLPFFH